MPAGGAAGSETDAVVAADGSCTLELAEGDYVAHGSRPGYESVIVDPFAVVDGAATRTNSTKLLMACSRSTRSQH